MGIVSSSRRGVGRGGAGGATMNWITNGLRYQVQLRALNTAGAGNPSQTTATPTSGP